MKSILRGLLLVGGMVGLAFFITPESAQAASRYWVGSSGGNWNDTANWTDSDPASCTGGGSSVPGSSDTVIFDADCDNNATMNATVSINTFTINSGYTGSISPSGSITISMGALTQADGTISFGSNAVTTNGAITLSGGTLTATSDTWTVKSNFTRTGGTFNHNSGTVKFDAGGATTYTFTPGSNLSFYNLTVTYSSNACDCGIPATLQFAADFTVANTFTVTRTSIDPFTVRGSSGINPTITVSGNVSFPSGSAATFGSTTASQNFTVAVAGDFTLATSSSVYANLIFNGTGNQTFTKSAGTMSTGTLTVNRPSETAGTALKLGANFSSSPFTVTAGTLDLNSYNLTSSASTVSSGGTLRLQGGETVTNAPTLSSGSTVTYNGTSSYTLKDWTYHHLTFNGSGGTFTMGADETLGGNLTITAGTLDVSASGCSSASCSLTVPGNWSNAGTFTGRTGTVTFSGTDQTISGSTTFYNLTKSVSSTATLTFTAGTTQTITNTLTLNGAASNLLSLRSSSNGSTYTIDPQGTRTFSYLDVKDSINSNATAITTCGSTCTNSLNNTNWKFIPFAPSSLERTNTATNATYTWVDNDADEDGFKIYNENDVLIATIATANTRTYTESGLTPNDPYQRYVVAYNTMGNSSASSTISFRTEPGATQSTNGGGEEEVSAQEPTAPSLISQAEKVSVKNPSIQTQKDGKETVIVLGKAHDTLTQSFKVTKDTYRLEIQAKHNSASPIKILVLVNNRPVRIVTLGKKDTKYSTINMGNLGVLQNGSVSFKLMKDPNSKARPNFYLDSWKLVKTKPVTKIVVKKTAISKTIKAVPKKTAPALARIVR